MTCLPGRDRQASDTANGVAIRHALFELFKRKAKGDRWPDTEYSPMFFYPETIPAEQGVRERNTDRAREPEACLHKGMVKEADYSLGTVMVNPFDQSPNINVKPNLSHTQLERGGIHPRVQEALPVTASERIGQGYDSGWKTSARARGAVARRLPDRYRGRLNTADPWGSLCELMAKGLPPEAIELALPTWPCFRHLAARLRALAFCCGNGLSLPDHEGGDGFLYSNIH